MLYLTHEVTEKKIPMPVVNRLAELTAEITEWRRDIHQHPELMYDVFRTAEMVQEKLTSFGCDEVVPALEKPVLWASSKGIGLGQPLGCAQIWMRCRFWKKLARNGLVDRR